MCGIAGSINIPLTEDSLSLIIHRGPDSMGLKKYINGKNEIYLGQTRLSIVDLSIAGFQPMVDSSGRYTILMNGEIYNHKELRLTIRGVTFNGHSDTETILYYLIQNGFEAVSKLNGIFSICFYDHELNKIYLARDPFGVKPLYYKIEKNKLVFSSEIKIITNLIGTPAISKDCLYTYLRLRFCPAPLTLFEGIFKINPGHYIEIDLSQEYFESKEIFYSYKPVKNFSISFDEALAQYDNLVRNAVKRQLMSDVPIAIMLSGGVDSALLAYLSQDLGSTKFSSYTIGFDVKTFANELEDADKTAKWLQTKHQSILLSERDFTDKAMGLIDILEEPVGSQSLAPFYSLTNKISSDGFKVALSGQGVDEGMAGYGRYTFQNFFDKLANPLWSVLKPLVYITKNDKLRRGINALSEKDRAKRYIESYSFFEQKEIHHLLKNDEFKKTEYENRLVNLIKQKAELYGLDKLDGLDYMLSLDIRLALSDDLLLYTDKISMKNSLEVRVPFLDVELMQFVESIPNKFKIGLKRSKILHKKLAEKYLPDEIIYRKKKGFYIPRNEWYKSGAGENILKVISSDEGIFSDLVNKEQIISMLKNHKENKYNYEDQIYSIMNLFYWIKNNINK
jgi:asparagine synthase (glutamine-hydrolysing)